MYNRKQRRILHSWMSKRHDLASSWSMYAADAPGNSGVLPEYDTVLGPVIQVFLRGVRTSLEKTSGFGAGLTPDTLCAALAAVGARMATVVTGDQYRVQSGQWTRVTGITDRGVISHAHRTGSGADFHAWCVSAHPDHRLIMFDPQSVFWSDDNRLVWGWADNIDLIGWKAHSATTARVIALANDHSTIVEYLYATIMEELLQRDLIAPSQLARAS